MTGYELHELLAANRELVSDTWNFFLSVHVAILGIIFIASGRVGFFQRLVLVAAYLGFMFTNYRAQTDNYSAQISIVEQIRSLTGPDAAIAQALINDQVMWITDYLMYVFAGAATVSSLIILLIRRD
ncbi:MAG: hypothetical protein AAGD92_06465 [Pseudomonadota bacterium]